MQAQSEQCREMQPHLHELALVASLHDVRLRKTLPWTILQSGEISFSSFSAEELWRNVTAQATTSLKHQGWRWGKHIPAMTRLLKKATVASKASVLRLMSTVLKERQTLAEAKATQLRRFMAAAPAVG